MLNTFSSTLYNSALNDSLLPAVVFLKINLTSRFYLVLFVFGEIGEKLFHEIVRHKTEVTGMFKSNEKRE